ncbi:MULTISPECIES: hypothetical protein [unclassified Bradyrhizobium]|uniref:hypothetical protein n=1 Tax=unclassified Bradyrhizobium TaxID=2631580 RepID=UPI002916057C|nr:MULTISPECIES: hypothetical protein [unclassified Bradyrhizobium]
MPKFRVALEASAAIGIEIEVDAVDAVAAEKVGTAWLSENRSTCDRIVSELISVDDNATRGYAEALMLPVTHVKVCQPDEEGFEVVDVFTPDCIRG